MQEVRWQSSLLAAVIAVGCGGRASDRSGEGGAVDDAESSVEGENGSESVPEENEPERTVEHDSDICAQDHVSVESAADGESLSNCETIAGTLDFQGGSDAPSLRSIETINEKLHFQYTTLEDVSVFAGLRDVGVLEIEGNGALESLDGLENLETVWAGIYIHGNPALVDLTALHGVRLVAGPVHFEGNIRLPTCQVAALLTALTENGSYIEEVSELDTVPCE